MESHNATMLSSRLQSVAQDRTDNVLQVPTRKPLERPVRGSRSSYLVKEMSRIEETAPWAVETASKLPESLHPYQTPSTESASVVSVAAVGLGWKCATVNI